MYKFLVFLSIAIIAQSVQIRQRNTAITAPSFLATKYEKYVLSQLGDEPSSAGILGMGIEENADAIGSLGDQVNTSFEAQDDKMNYSLDIQNLSATTTIE